jgi:hypothetical protein
VKCLLLFFAALGAFAADSAFLFVSPRDAAGIKAAVKAREPWTAASVRELRRDAERAIKEGPWSVTFERPKNIAADPHDYYSEAPYFWPDPKNPSGPYIRHDGKTYPGRFLGNKSALGAMSEAVFTLGAAAWLFDEPRYASRATTVLRVWFLDPKTRMNPNLEYGQAIPNLNTGRGTGIIDTRPLIRCLEGVRFLEAAGKWDGADRAGLRRWFAGYVNWLNTSKKGLQEREAKNNHGSWWAAQVAAYASYAEDSAALEVAWQRYRTLLATEIRPDGTAPLEEARTKSLGYSAFNVEAHANLCRMAEVRGLDLWHFRAPNGVTLRTAIDFLLPYLANPRAWTKPQIVPFENDRMYWLAFAGEGLRVPEYEKLYKRLEKPGGSWLAWVDLMAGRASTRPGSE